MIVAYISLGIAIATLVIAILIQSTTGDALSHINAVTYTLPSAYDVDRIMKDIEKTGQFRGKVVCNEPKTTNLAFEMPPKKAVPLNILISAMVWKSIRKAANCFSGSIDVPVKMPNKVVWEVKLPTETSEAEELMANGWEPFSTTNEGKFWLRKRKAVFEETVS